jgi:hypothetical protein
MSSGGARPHLVVPKAGVAVNEGGSLVDQLRKLLDGSSAPLSEEAKMDVMRQLWEIVLDQRSAIVDQTDEIVAFLTRQVELSFGDGQADGSIHHRHARYALNTLLELFKAEEMARGVRAPTLEHLTRLLLLKLMDEGLKAHPDPQCRSLTMAVNVLVLKVLENSDRTAIFHTLLKFLANGPGTTGAGSARDAATNRTFVDLVVRSLMKMVKNLSNERFLAGLHLPSLLRDIHDFWAGHKVAPAAGAASGSPAPDDLPIKAVKAMIATLVNVRGEALRQDLPKDLHASNSTAISYLERTLAYNAKRAAGGNPLGSPVQAAAATSSASAATAAGSKSTEPQVARRLQLDDDESDATSKPAATTPAATPTDAAAALPLDPVQQLLSEIVARTVKPATTQSALRELHEFTLTHPTVDIWPAFHLQGESFKAYVKRNLLRMQTEAAGATPTAATIVAATTPRVAPTPSAALATVVAPPVDPTATAGAAPGHSRTPSSSDPAAAAAAASSTALYRQRLSVLQDRAKMATAVQAGAAAGLAPTPSPSSATLSSSSSSSSLSAAPAVSPAVGGASSSLPHTQSLSSIDAIRARFKSARSSDENSAPAPADAQSSAASGVGSGLSAAPTTQQPAATGATAPAVSSIEAIKARIAAMNNKQTAPTAP